MRNQRTQLRIGLARLHSCETCRIRAYAERNPRSIISRIWHWHTGWCPLLKAHEKKLAAEQPGKPPEPPSEAGA